VSRLQRLSTIFAPFYPRGAAFQELSDLLSDEEISQDEVRKRVRFLLAVPEEVLRRPPPSLGRGAEMGLALSGR
ncbi:MAG: hypothetical protein KDD47_23355, partial [Acidobacteria bacterium]|nr:hypothetical protein [Acidobacteriota bacterium]